MQTERDNGLIVKERESSKEVSDVALSIMNKSPISVEGNEKIGSLTPEVKHLKVIFI